MLKVFIDDNVASEAHDRRLDTLRERFEATGESLILFEAIELYLRSRCPVPEWATRAFCKAVQSVQEADVGSWDTAFGRPYPKGTRLSTVRRRRKMEIYDRVQKIRK